MRQNRRSLHAALAVALLSGTVGLLAPASPVHAQCLGTARTITLDPARGSFYNGLEKSLGLRDGEVILTFDDGPVPGPTTRILDALRDECAKATFFVSGRMADSYPSVAQRVRREGHTLANHTHTHANLAKVGSDAMVTELDRGNASIRKATGISSPPFFRYPYLARTARTDQIVRSRGMIAFGTNIDSKDYKKVSPNQVHDTIMRKLRKQRKGIVLMHDIHNRTASMLPRLLDTLKAEGFKVVHMVPGSGGGVVADTVMAKLPPLDVAPKVASVSPKPEVAREKAVLASTTANAYAEPETANVTRKKLPLPLDLLAEKGRPLAPKVVKTTSVTEKLRNRIRVRAKYRVSTHMPLNSDGIPLLRLSKR